jgi:hypothetical protein
MTRWRVDAVWPYLRLMGGIFLAAFRHPGRTSWVWLDADGNLRITECDPDVSSRRPPLRPYPPPAASRWLERRRRAAVSTLRRPARDWIRSYP